MHTASIRNTLNITLFASFFHHICPKQVLLVVISFWGLPRTGTGTATETGTPLQCDPEIWIIPRLFLFRFAISQLTLPLGTMWCVFHNRQIATMYWNHALARVPCVARNAMRTLVPIICSCSLTRALQAALLQHSELHFHSLSAPPTLCGG